MARYTVTIPSSKSADDAFAYMSDMRTFTDWDPGISRVTQVTGVGGGAGAVFDVAVKGFAGRDTILRYETTEFDPPRTVLLRGRNSLFTSVDRVTVEPTSTGSTVTYDAVLTMNGLLSPMNLALGLVFNKIGDRAAKGLRRALT
jgi:hypothetical protein